jgi:HEPN domain-containing protein
LIRQERRLHAAAVYHCQQSAEKMFKAWLTQQAIVFPKTHDLEVLLHLCRKNGARFADLDEAARELTPLATLFRYPGDADVPALEESNRALALAEVVFARVTSEW